MNISLVAAISKNNCIGKNGEIPWHLPEDMKHVKELTTGNVVVMGRKTWESIPKKYRPLPNRTNVVITRQENYGVPDGVFVYTSIEEALEAHAGEQIIGFGGQMIYEDLMSRADTLEITHVDKNVDACDAFFPNIDLNIWKETKREDHDGFSFVTYKKANSQ